MHKDNKAFVLEKGIKGYETSDVNGRRFAYFMTILAVTTILCAFVALFAYQYRRAEPKNDPVAIVPVMEQRALPPLPRLQERPQIDIEAFREAENQRLTKYAVIDKTAGIVQIPVDRAMEIIAEKGLPHGREAHVPGQGQPAAATAAPAPASTDAQSTVAPPVAVPGTTQP